MSNEPATSNKRSTLLLIGIVFIIGVLAGWMISYFRSNKNTDAVGVRQGGYTYINPLLECEINSSLENKSLVSFKRKIEEVINEKNSQGLINHVSVYYRDLNNGPWFGINEKETFSPASLLKVPMMMTYLKQVELDVDILNTEIEFDPTKIDLPNFTEQEHTLTPNQKYTIDELIRKIIIDSDNDAFYLLTFITDTNLVNKIHSDLGLAVADQNTPEDFITVKSYASLFRVLFNASYLSRDMSEYALSLLSQASFKDGLVAGIPENVIVAHKYGIYVNKTSSEKQMHDCGIIYYPNHPYLICVMTRGENFDNLTETIKTISESIYQEIDNQYKN